MTVGIPSATPSISKLSEETDIMRKIISLSIISVLTLGAVLGIAAVDAHFQAQSASRAQVSNFDDGYATAMRDACQGHDAYACQWLADNNGGK